MSLASTRSTLTVVLAIAAATITAALASQYGFGLVPCKLCLWQRWPYYLGIPVGLATLVLPSGSQRRIGLGLVALVFAAGAALGTYHAGAEWALWAGPSDCGGGISGPDSAADLLQTLGSIRVVSCTDAAWRFSGISLAGWNGLISAGLALLSGWAAWRGDTSGTDASRLAQARGRVPGGAASIDARDGASASA